MEFLCWFTKSTILSSMATGSTVTFSFSSWASVYSCSSSCVVAVLQLTIANDRTMTIKVANNLFIPGVYFGECSKLSSVLVANLVEGLTSAINFPQKAHSYVEWHKSGAMCDLDRKEEAFYRKKATV